MTKKEKLERQQKNIDYLRSIINEHDHIYCKVIYCSRSGMSRHVMVLLPTGWNGRPGIANITYNVANAIDFRLNKDRDGIVVGGCGYSVTEHVIEHLSWALFGNADALKCEVL